MRIGISIVYSSHLGAVANGKFEDMLRETSGLTESNLEILAFENYNQYSLSEIYNKGLAAAKFNIILFIHNDIEFRERNWGPELLKKFAETEYGILGLIGSSEMKRDIQKGFWPGNPKRYAGFIYQGNKTGTYELRLSNKLQIIAPAVVVDGLFIAVNKNRIKEFFDVDFKGFHYYDISFCIRNHIKGVKIGIIADHTIQLYHQSAGSFDKDYHINKALFLSKYPEDYVVPIEIDIPRGVELDPKIKDDKTVHIIIPASDDSVKLFQCLESIYEYTKYANYCVWIVVADTNELKPLIAEKIIELNGNYLKFGSSSGDVYHFNIVNLMHHFNFSKTNNEVIHILKRQNIIDDQDFILFCDASLRLLNDCLSGCVHAYAELEKDGIKPGTLGIRLHNTDNTINKCGIAIYLKNNQVHLIRKYEGYAYKYCDGTEQCLINSKVFMFTSYKLFKDLTMFNENYHESYQDVEFNLKCLLNGYSNYLLGNMVACVHESVAPGIADGSSALVDWNNHLFPFIIKHRKQLTPFFKK